MRTYKQDRRTLTQVAAAARAGNRERSAGRIDALPSQREARRWRTLEDPLSGVWDAEVVPLLQTDVLLNAVKLLEELQRRHGDDGPSGSTPAGSGPAAAGPSPAGAAAGPASGDAAQGPGAGSASAEAEALQQAMADLENINAHLFSIEALMERVFDVRVPDEVEQVFRELAGELAPDPLNADRLRLNRLLHQTPDLPDRG